jgi:hypothetical protein
MTMFGDRPTILRDLIAGRHVRIEIVFTIERRPCVYIAVKHEARQHGRFDTATVEHLYKASPIYTHIEPLTGNVPGSAASNSATQVFGDWP